MNLEENNEQPPSAVKPPSDFNDLHVLAGLEEVRRQIETAISSSDFAFDVSPQPLNLTDHNLGEMLENNGHIDYSDDAFQLDFAPPMNFLNGVCRHEHCPITFRRLVIFLNGVCRHEPSNFISNILIYFLNGVCRHERIH